MCISPYFFVSYEFPLSRYTVTIYRIVAFFEVTQNNMFKLDVSYYKIIFVVVLPKSENCYSECATKMAIFFNAFGSGCSMFRLSI